MTLPELAEFVKDATEFYQNQQVDTAYVEVKVITVQGAVKDIRSGHMYKSAVNNPVLYLR